MTASRPPFPAIIVALILTALSLSAGGLVMLLPESAAALEGHVLLAAFLGAIPFVWLVVGLFARGRWSGAFLSIAGVAIYACILIVVNGLGWRIV